jgi:type III secretory pathway lipoprotein EscJ
MTTEKLRQNCAMRVGHCEARETKRPNSQLHSSYLIERFRLKREEVSVCQRHRAKVLVVELKATARHTRLQIQLERLVDEAFDKETYHNISVIPINITNIDDRFQIVRNNSKHCVCSVRTGEVCGNPMTNALSTIYLFILIFAFT